MLGIVSKVAATGTRIQTVTMWSMRCFFGESMFPAVPLLKTNCRHLESYFKRSDVQFCVKECDRGVRD